MKSIYHSNSPRNHEKTLNHTKVGHINYTLIR